MNRCLTSNTVRKSVKRRMFEKFIKAYSQKKMQLIQNFTSTDIESLYEETDDIDDGEIEARIELLKKEYEQTNSELRFVHQYDAKDEVRSEKLRFLIAKSNDIKEEMAFWASNRLENIDMCKSLMNESQRPFSQCLKALEQYRDGNYPVAFDLLDSYIQDGNDFAKHFLLNKIYAQHLLEKNAVAVAEQYCKRAEKLRPENREIHLLLANIYDKLSMPVRQKKELAVADLLEG